MIEFGPDLVLPSFLKNCHGAEERAKKEQVEKEQEWLRQKHKEQQQHIEAQNRSLEENIVQLRKKLEKDRDETLREQTRILEHKLKVSLAMTSKVAHNHHSGK